LREIPGPNIREKKSYEKILCRPRENLLPFNQKKIAVYTYSEETTLSLTDKVSLYFIHLDLSRIFPSLSARYYGQLYHK